MLLPLFVVWFLTSQLGKHWGGKRREIHQNTDIALEATVLII